MDEIWKDIKGYEGLYQISNLGRVKNYERKVRICRRGYEGLRIHKERIMKPSINNRGYAFVSLCKDGKYKTKFVHRMVAENFISNPNNYPCVNHKDENPLNNSIDNLEWCTYAYNNAYGGRNERISKSRKGMKFTDEHRANLSKSHKAIVTDEFREKMKQIHLGTKLSEEHRQHIKDGLKRHYSN